MAGPLRRRPTRDAVVEILSEDDEDAPPPIAGPGVGSGSREEVEVLFLDDDDPTPQKERPVLSSDRNKQDATTLVVPETPAFASQPPVLRACSTTSAPLRPNRLICLESDDEDGTNKDKGISPKGSPSTRNSGQCNTIPFCDEILLATDPTEVPTANYELAADEFDIGSSYKVVHGLTASSLKDQSCTGVQSQVHDIHGIYRLETDPSKQKHEKATATSTNKSKKEEKAEKKKQKKEEKCILNEERKRKRQEERLQKEALKAEAAEMKKLQKEKYQWERGKFALKSIIAEVDVKVVENGAVGGQLLSRFAEKGLTYQITTNKMEKSIMWKMNIPDQISKLSSMGAEVPYVAFVYEAEEFCNLLSTNSFWDHVHKVKRQYPSFTACYVINKLLSYTKKREQSQYRNPSDISGWQRPPIEEVLAKLTTDFDQLHSRLCIDEADLAEHIVGLTSSLGACRFRKKLTWLSVNSNGSIVPKGFIDKNLIRRSSWLKALVAIPRVQPRFAIAISNKYPTMRSLLNVYMDPQISVHQKEFLLKDLVVEGEMGKEDRRVGEACSKRVYRILTAQNGFSKTDDVENGADFF